MLNTSISVFFPQQDSKLLVNKLFTLVAASIASVLGSSNLPRCVTILNVVNLLTVMFAICLLLFYLLTSVCVYLPLFRPLCLPAVTRANSVSQRAVIPRGC